MQFALSYPAETILINHTDSKTRAVQQMCHYYLQTPIASRLSKDTDDLNAWYKAAGSPFGEGRGSWLLCVELKHTRMLKLANNFFISFALILSVGYSRLAGNLQLSACTGEMQVASCRV